MLDQFDVKVLKDWDFHTTYASGLELSSDQWVDKQVDTEIPESVILHVEDS